MTTTPRSGKTFKILYSINLLILAAVSIYYSFEQWTQEDGPSHSFFVSDFGTINMELTPFWLTFIALNVWGIFKFPRRRILFLVISAAVLLWLGILFNETPGPAFP